MLIVLIHLCLESMCLLFLFGGVSSETTKQLHFLGVFFSKTGTSDSTTKTCEEQDLSASTSTKGNPCIRYLPPIMGIQAYTSNAYPHYSGGKKQHLWVVKESLLQKTSLSQLNFQDSPWHNISKRSL